MREPNCTWASTDCSSAVRIVLTRPRQSADTRHQTGAPEIPNFSLLSEFRCVMQKQERLPSLAEPRAPTPISYRQKRARYALIGRWSEDYSSTGTMPYSVRSRDMSLLYRVPETTESMRIAAVKKHEIILDLKSWI